MASYIANDMRVGWVISHNGKRYSVLSITKVKPGKGGAFVQADLRDIDSGNKDNNRWREIPNANSCILMARMLIS